MRGRSCAMQRPNARAETAAPQSAVRWYGATEMPMTGANIMRAIAIHNRPVLVPAATKVENFQQGQKTALVFCLFHYYFLWDKPDKR